MENNSHTDTANIQTENQRQGKETAFSFYALS